MPIDDNENDSFKIVVSNFLIWSQIYVSGFKYHSSVLAVRESALDMAGQGFEYQLGHTQAWNSVIK